MRLKKSSDGQYHCPIHNTIVIPFIVLNGFRKWKEPNENGCWCPPPKPNPPVRVK